MPSEKNATKNLNENRKKLKHFVKIILHLEIGEK